MSMSTMPPRLMSSSTRESIRAGAMVRKIEVKPLKNAQPPEMSIFLRGKPTIGSLNHFRAKQLARTSLKGGSGVVLANVTRPTSYPTTTVTYDKPLIDTQRASSMPTPAVSAEMSETTKEQSQVTLPESADTLTSTTGMTEPITGIKTDADVTGASTTPLRGSAARLRQQPQPRPHSMSSIGYGKQKRYSSGAGVRPTKANTVPLLNEMFRAPSYTSSAVAKSKKRSNSTPTVPTVVPGRTGLPSTNVSTRTNDQSSTLTKALKPSSKTNKLRNRSVSTRGVVIASPSGSNSQGTSLNKPSKRRGLNFFRKQKSDKTQPNAQIEQDTERRKPIKEQVSWTGLVLLGFVGLFCMPCLCVNYACHANDDDV
jgi:hypothetical protein